MTYTIDKLLFKIKEAGKNYEVDKILAAYELANEAHEGQMRSSGEPYISHPLAVAATLLDFNMDTDTIVSAILHDVIEDTDTNLKIIEKRFGKDVALLVDGVTKLDKVPLNTKEEQLAENIRKILINMSKDVRIMLIKLSDRLHNMSTLAARPPEKQKDTALETMSFYAPIAHRLGMNSIKEQMEDLSLQYLDPYAYAAIHEQITMRKEQREVFIERIKERILERLAGMNPDPVVEGRVKGVYSIYKKIYVDNKSFDEIFDIYAVRIIVHSDIDCYNVLGVIHDLFRPIPGRFKDYIATPKPNRYQSLHTTVIAKEGKIPFEVQIRTLAMHNTAEYGVAAHWKYKESGKTKARASELDKLEWIRTILDQQQEAGDVQHITEAIKTDLSPEDVYVFTPKGEIITLPKGSTVIDFAYSIHSEIGHKMTGAKVGGKMTNFEHKLETGEIVEIMTTNSDHYGPNRNWLDIVKTNQAKVKIRAWFKKERRPENISQGKVMIERELKRNNIPFDMSCIEETANALRFEDPDDFFACVGYGGMTLIRAVQKIKDVSAPNIISTPITPIEVSEIITKKQAQCIMVEGIENCLVKFAKCCAPLPGDDIIGFITRGHGVSVHKKSCENILQNKDTERLISTMWISSGNMYYRAGIEIIAEDRMALLADISSVISENRLSINEFNAKSLKNGNSCINVTMEIAGVEQLNGIIAKLRKVPGVLQAMRKEG